MTLKILLGLALALAALIALAACNGAAALNAVTPSGQFERQADLAFGDHPRQKLDLYSAVSAKPGAPAVLFVHGGSWQDGSKDLYKFVGDAFARRGFDVAVSNYRLYPEARYPDMVEDTALAAAWLRERTGGPVVLVGHSAGGYNVLQTVFAPEIARSQGLEPCDDVAGVVALAAPTGAYPLEDAPYPTIFPQRFLGDDAPLVRARNGTVTPPLLLVHGRDDTTVGPKNSTDLAKAATAEADTVLYEGLGHIDVVRVLSRFFDGDADVMDEIAAFIEGLPEPDEGSGCPAAS